jgi:hypothetical protein
MKLTADRMGLSCQRSSAAVLSARPSLQHRIRACRPTTVAAVKVMCSAWLPVTPGLHNQTAACGAETDCSGVGAFCAAATAAD